MLHAFREISNLIRGWGAPTNSFFFLKCNGVNYQQFRDDLLLSLPGEVSREQGLRELVLPDKRWRKHMIWRKRA